MKDNKITIIAEMAYGHDGSLELAKKIAMDAADARADAISIHITSVPDYVSIFYETGKGRVSAGKEGKPFYDYLNEISLTFEEWRLFVDFINSINVSLIIMPNDVPSLEFSITLNPDAYVIPASNFEEYEFIDAVGRIGKPVYLRVGGASIGEIDRTIRLLNQAGTGLVTLLYGHQNYPTVIGDTNLSFIRYLKEMFDLPVGIADHVDGDDDFATIAPLLAIPMGISCIEKHLTYDRANKGEDYEAALNKIEFATMVQNIRKAESALIDKGLVGFTENTEIYRQNHRKRVVASRDIEAGEVLSRELIEFKRSDDGMSPSQMDWFLGMSLTEDVKKDCGIELRMFQHGTEM